MALSALETVHNYFERFVFSEISENYHNKGLNEQAIADMACIALNHIPPKYIRFDIDMSFYMSNEEYWENQDKVKKAVQMAYEKVTKNQH